ncbi:MAG: SdpI family protein [Acutalibacteraceae bacterium]
MGYWVFMLIMDLLIPLIMTVFGGVFMKRPPAKINPVFGYRTSMSMKNSDTWDFAHKYCGRIWFACGSILFVITLVCFLLIIGKSVEFIGNVGGMLCMVQLIPLVGAIFPTEIALRRNFDKNGNRR